MSSTDPSSPTAAARILHICPRPDWVHARSAGEYRPHSLQSEGFIHCSTDAQVLGVANSLYGNAGDLVLLVIDPQALTAPLVYEDCYKLGQDFPHIYGALNIEAVVTTVPFPQDVDGRFSFPDQLRSPT
jgi:uncharacterized protein (DUF952 family)